jgi:hypothetical protein
MNKTRIMALATIGLLLASPGVAQDEETAGSVRCLLVSLQSSMSQNSLIGGSGLMSMFYWLGRLDGHAPDLDLEARIMDEIAQFSAEKLQAEALRCGAILKGRGEALTKMGKDMQEKGRKMLLLENSR